jgi:hypothetical protein
MWVKDCCGTWHGWNDAEKAQVHLPRPKGGKWEKVPIEHGNLVATASKWARVCLTLKGWGMHPSAKCTC